MHVGQSSRVEHIQFPVVVVVVPEPPVVVVPEPPEVVVVARVVVVGILVVVVAEHPDEVHLPEQPGQLALLKQQQLGGLMQSAHGPVPRLEIGLYLQVSFEHDPAAGHVPQVASL